MGVLSKLRKNSKYVRLADVLQIFPFILVLPLALLFRVMLKVRGKTLWLICESPDTARDNGYQFFSYLRQHHTEIPAYYAVARHSADRHKVAPLGNIINYGSLKHWLYYLAADENISTQKAGNPAPALFYLLHIYNIIRNNRTFLQHGITKDDAQWLYYADTKFKLFICGAKQEYDYVKATFGYPDGAVVYTGLARFDALSTAAADKKQVLLMPTWRSWLARQTNGLAGNKQDFSDSTFYKRWASLLQNRQLTDYLEQNNSTLYFYPHFEMQKYVDCFQPTSKNVRVVSKSAGDVQDLLQQSALLVTDYSSVFFDFAYMGKPVLYYQFDEAEYRAKQYRQGYFSYRRDGFGPVETDEQAIVERIINSISNNFAVGEPYRQRAGSFFTLRDHDNCKRIYEAIVASGKATA